MKLEKGILCLLMESGQGSQQICERRLDWDDSKFSKVSDSHVVQYRWHCPHREKT